MSAANNSPYVGRGGLKLAHALDDFKIDPTGLRCADLGCSTGGFTDCLLQRGATGVIAVDTGYGVLDYRLRTDPRVTVLERSNALHLEPPERVDLVVIDIGWTPQRLAIPAALRWLGSRDAARIITLIKPHYERSAEGGRQARHGVLDPEEAEAIAERVYRSMPDWGAEGMGLTRSPITGGKGKSKGNLEWLALVRPAG